MFKIVTTCRRHGPLSIEQATGRGKYKRCKICTNEASANWKAANRDKHRASANRKRDTDPIAKEARNAKVKADRAKDNTVYIAQARRNRTKQGSRRTTVEIARRRGIKVEEYEKMFEKQDHKCAICKQPEKRIRPNGLVSRLSLDHDHVTGKVRELLCSDCNTGIGKFKENIELIQDAINYLVKHKGD